MLHYTHTSIDSTRGCVGVAVPARAVRRAGWLYGCPDICSRALISSCTHGGTVRPSACPAVPASILVLPRPHGAAVRPVRAVCCRPDDMSVQHLRGLAPACLPCAGCPGCGCPRSGAAVGCPGALPPALYQKSHIFGRYYIFGIRKRFRRAGEGKTPQRV